MEKVVVEGRHEPIISKEDFERVQKMIKVRCKNNNVGAGIPKNVWSKKLKCECGSSFNKRLYHKKDTVNTYCFQCYHQKTYGSLNTRIKRGLPTDDVCNVPLVPDWKLYTMANFLFRKIWSDKDKIKEVINKLLDEVITDKEACNDLENEINNINVKINTNNNKLKNLLDMVLNEYINKEEYKTKKEEIEKNNELLENQKKELENKYGIPKDSLKERIKNIKKKVDEYLGNANKSVSDDMLEEIVESITVHKNYFEWKLNYLNDIIELNINSRQGKSTGNTLYVDEVELVTQTTSLHKRLYAKRRTISP